MTCAYHPGQPIIASCQSCRQGLCRACDHRIRGIPYCQDCIVAGIELLRLQQSRPSLHFLTQPAPSTRVEEPAARRSVLLALLFSLFPGLGAVYNGQNVKALLHFILIAGLWTLADLFSDSLESLLAAAGGAVYLFSIFDACRTAKRTRLGIDQRVEDEQIRAWLRENTNLAGIGLIAIGSLTTLNSLFPALLNRFWPVMMILLGLFLLRLPLRVRIGREVSGD